MEAAMGEPLLEVDNLRTQFPVNDGTIHAVDGVSFKVWPGETVGIVGESGSGKSVTAASLMGLIPEPGRIVSGSIRFRGQDVTKMSRRDLRSLRGRHMAMVFQDPMSSLNPLLRISSQLEEAMLVHGQFDRPQAAERAKELIGQMGVGAPERAVRSYPHEFSGGMRQRVMLAMGVSNEPALLIADEPTTALDVTIQAQFLELLRQLNRDLGLAVILISHDLGVVADLCSRVLVMYGGQVVEEGPTERLLRDPKHPYTWALINAVPRLDRAGQRRLPAIEGEPPDALRPPSGCRFAARCPFRIAKCAEPPPLLEVEPGHRASCWVTQAGTSLSNDAAAQTGSSAASLTIDRDAPSPSSFDPTIDRHPGSGSDDESPVLLDLVHVTKHFPVRHGLSASGRGAVVHAVDDVSLQVRRGETLGLVGESGCGKSTLARLIVRLYEPTSGQIVFENTDISHLSERALRPIRRRLQMVFQDPYSSLNSRMKVRDIIAEPLRVHHLVDGESAVASRVAELLRHVGLPSRSAGQFPHEFSGGQRQRIGLARALAMDPEVIVADEPISSLDVNIQAQVINLLEDLQDRLGLTYVFIAHDLSVVRHVSDRIAVLYLGKLAELATKADLYERPLHPYTAGLISSALLPDVETERKRTRVFARGEIPSSINPPSGCRYRTRCPIAQQICAEIEPPLIEHRPGQFAACHFPGVVENSMTAPAGALAS